MARLRFDKALFYLGRRPYGHSGPPNGYSGHRPGEGERRAQERLAATMAAEAKRLANAPMSEPSRQVRRRAARKGRS